MSIEKDSRTVHDLGGQLHEPFNHDEHDYLPWEKRVHAIRELLAQKKLMSVDELRRNVEGLGEEKYKSLSYYEQWILATSQVMLERGIFTNDELTRRIEEVKARHD